MKPILLLLSIFALTFSFAQASVTTSLSEKFEPDRIFETELAVPGEIVPELLKEFKAGAVFYKVDYEKEYDNISHIIFVKKDFGFIGGISKDEKTIYLNRELLQYPNLTRVIFFRQLGKLYGAKEGNPSNHAIMSPHWDIDKQHERLAINTRSRPDQRKEFFKNLEELKPLNKRL